MDDNQDVGLMYIRTLPGILKIAEEIVNFIGMICIASLSYTPRGDAFLASSIMALIITALIFVFHLTGLVAKVQIPWYKLEFGYSVFISIFYLITSSLIVSSYYGFKTYIAAGIFGYLAILLYVADAFLQYQAIMS